MNKRERMQAAFENRQADCIPAGFWHHYTERDPKQLIAAQLDFYKVTNMDFLKIMYEFMFDMDTRVTRPSDWYHIKPGGTKAPQFKTQLDIIRGILDGVNEDTMAFTTMFGAMKMAAWCIGDEGLMVHAKEDPAALKAGLNVFADTLCEWADGFLNAGLDGIFYSAQFGEIGRFCKEEWHELVEPYDLRVLNTIKEKNKRIILHLCGEPDYKFKVHIDRYGGYPMDMVNWAIHANHYELERGRDFFGCPILGGLDNKGAILNGTKDEVADLITAIIQNHKTCGFVLGADCSVQGAYNVDLITHAVAQAHSFRFQKEI